MKKSLILLLFFITGLPLVTSAHVKWFVDTKDILSASQGVSILYTWTSKETLVWSLITLLVVVFFSIIDRYIHEPLGLLKFAYKHELTINKIAQVLLGIFLISVSFIWHVVIVPEVTMNSPILIMLGGIQVAIGSMFLVNFYPRIASAILFFLIIGIGIYSEGFIMILENSLLITLSIYFYIVNSPKDSWVSLKLYKHAVEIVRIGVGVSLIVLAFTEKILYPELGLQFLDAHQWNFMQGILPWFTNELFVFSTGFAEMIFGILFIMGYLTRTTTILIALFFAVSVIAMLVQFNIWEVEDLVVYAAAILLIFFGHGRTKFFHFKWPKYLQIFDKKIIK